MTDLSIELGTAYISVVGDTKKLADDVKSALNGVGKEADRAGTDIGQRLSKTASKALRDGWRPDQDIMAGIPDTKLDRVGARIGQIIGNGIGAGIRANEAGKRFTDGFAQGAGSLGIGRIVAKARAELTGGNALTSMGALAGKTFAAGLTGAVTLGVGGLVAGIGMALSGGIKRLLTIDQAKFKLKGLGKSTQEIADIVKTVTDSVTGTPFSLDEAFATATQAIGANVQDLKRFMTDVSDAAGFASVDISRMGLIFNQVLAKGKLQGDDMMQLMEAGLPAKSWIEDSYKLTSDQFDKMQADGQITMEMLEKAVEDHAGGMSKKLGESLQGSIDNMKTAVSRVGADFLTAIFGGDSSKATDTMAQNINKITDKLNELDGWVKSHGPQIQSTFKTIGQGISDGLKIGIKAVTDLTNDIKLLASGLANIIGAMASFDEFLNKIPGMGGNEQEAAKLRALQQGLAQWAGPNIFPNEAGAPGGIDKGNYPYATVPGGGNGPHGKLNPPWTSRGASPSSESDNGFTNGIPNAQANAPAGTRESGGLPGGADITNSFGGPGGGGRGLIMGPVGNDPIERWRPMVQQALAMYGSQYGITNPSAWEAAMMRQIATESGGDPTVFNNWDSNAKAGYPSRGLLQFIPSTFAAHNITGGDIMDPQAQIAAFIPYVMQRYGVDKNGAPLQVGRGVGYAAGGGVWGAGSATSDSIPALLSNGEHVLTAKDVQAMGGQGKVYAFRQALHRAGGGSISLAQVPFVPGLTGKLGEQAGNLPNRTGGSGYPGVIGFPDWGTPGTVFGAPPSDWWNKPINPDDILNPEFMPPGQRGEWWDRWKKKRIRPFAKGGAVDMLKQLNGPIEDSRTAGAIPAAAGNMGKAGDSTIAKAIGMGGEVINGIIDQAASAASTAAAAGIAAGTFGAGAAGGSQAGAAAAQFAIGMGTNAAKRGVTYGFDMLGIGADTILQQLMPFGMPRWLSTDPGAFMPNDAIQGALKNLMTSGADKGTDQQTSAVDPNTVQHGLANGAAPGPAMSALTDSTQPQTPAGPGDAIHGDSMGAPPGPDPNSLLSTEFNPPAGADQPTVLIQNAYAQDSNQLADEISRQQRLAAMQYTGRPGP